MASHGQLWEYEVKLAMKLGEWVRDAWLSTSSVHVCFYEGRHTERDVEDVLARVKKLVEAIEKNLGKDQR